jgi:hypothetical protein
MDYAKFHNLLAKRVRFNQLAPANAYETGLFSTKVDQGSCAACLVEMPRPAADSRLTGSALASQGHRQDDAPATKHSRRRCPLANEVRRSR